MKNKIKNYLLFPFDVIFLIFFILISKLTKKNYNQSVPILIRLFCVTGGVSNYVVSLLTRTKIKKKNKPHHEFKDLEFSEINDNLNNNGYYLFENFLSKHDCEKLENYTLNNSLIAKSDSNLNSTKEVFFDASNPHSVIYEMKNDKILRSEIAQNLLFNKFIYQVATNYFRSTPFFDHISLAISGKSDKPDSEAAQMFHFDLDKPKWLKFFIYLNDVDENNGPHFFIPKTHKNFAIKSEIRAQGYKRIDDKTISKYYPNIKEMKGKSGTLLIEDTRGLHKGSVVKKNYRCIALLQFNNSNFGSQTSQYNLNVIKKDNLEFYNSNIYSFSNLNIIK